MLDGDLLQLAQRAVATTGLAASEPDAMAGLGSLVVVDATARDGDGAALLAQLQTLGLEGGASVGGLVSGSLPVAQIAQLSTLSNLLFVRQSLAQAGAVISQGDHAQATDAARTTYGVDGTGIKVGILSDSFNSRNALATDQASGELPGDVTILAEGPSNGSDEGRAMAQIIHDVAPGASILFATAFTGLANFAQNIIALADAGAKVIVDDVSYFAEPTYQDSAVAQAIAQVTARGVTYLSSAGNSSNKGYEAAFNPAAAPTTIRGYSTTLHQFAPGQDYIPVTIGSANTRIVFSLQWDNPARSISANRGATSDIDVYIYDETGTQLIEYADGDSIRNGDPVEVFTITSGSAARTTYQIKIGLYDGAAPSNFKLMALGNGAPVSLGGLASNTNDGTVFGHAAAKDAIAVGAAYYKSTPAYGMSPPALESFSSTGPTLFTYDTAGNRLATPELRTGPIITAPDGADTSFFGNDRDGNGQPNFSGTSAAAPHAAGLAALMLQANPSLTSADIRALLADGVIDMDNPHTAGFDTGFDVATGYGLVQGTSVGFAKTGIITNAAHNPVLFGTHLDDVLVGGSGGQILTGNGGRNTYRGAATELDADIVSDFATRDLIDVTDASRGFSTLGYASGLLSFTLAGWPETTYAMTLKGGVAGTPLQRSNGTGGSAIYFASALVAAPTVALSSASDSGVSDTDGITRLTTLTLVGTGSAGDTVSLYDDANANAIQDAAETTLASVTVGSDGRYSTAVTLAEGRHAMRAYQNGSSGTSNSSSAAMTTVDTTAPVVTGIVPNVTGPTNATAFTQTVTFSEDVSGLDATDFTLRHGDGSAVEGATVGDPISTDGGRTFSVTVSGVSANGPVHLDLNATGTGIQDTAGNLLSGGATGSSVIIDQVAPTIAGIVPSSTGPTNATALTQTVTFSEDVTGVDAGDFVLTRTGTAGATISDITGSGTTYTVSLTGVTGDGTVRLDLKGTGTGIQDAAGNAAAGFTAGGITTLDHTAPTITLALTSGTGLDERPLATDSQSGAAILNAEAFARSFRIGGRVADANLDDGSGALVVLAAADGHDVPSKAVLLKTDAGGRYYAFRVDAPGTAGNPNAALATALSDGTYTLGAGTRDMAGNIGRTDVRTLIVDTTADAGSDAAVVVDATADGILNAAEARTTHFTVSGLDVDATAVAAFTDGTRTASATVGANGAGTIDLSGFDGTIRTSLAITDRYGNRAAVTGAVVKADTTTPLAPVGLALASASDSGTAGDRLTNVARPTLTGQTEAGAQLSLYDGATLIATGTAAATGAFAIAPAAALADGQHDLRLSATDAAGNVGPTASLSLTIDTQAPSAPGLALAHDTGPDAGDGVTSDAGLVVTGEIGASLRYSIDGGADAASYDAAALTEGGHTVAVTQTDVAGNTSAAARLAFTLDRTAPAATGIGPSTAGPTNATDLTQTVRFSEAVTGVDVDDFALTATGTAAARIAGVSGTGSLYTVALADVSGDGTLRLDLKSTGTGIRDVAGNAITDGFTAGGATILDHSGPLVLGLSAAAASPNANELTYTLAFSEAVTGLDSADLVLRDANGNSVVGASIETPVSSDGGKTYGIVVKGLSSINGQAHLDLKDSGTGIQDRVGNLLTGGATGTSVTLSHPRPALTDDFNGDGKSDILWRNTDGTLIEWEMDGAAVISGGVIGSDSNWSVVGTGDFNGDGKTDLLQRDARTGHVLQTLMNGRTAIGAQVIGGDQDWKVAGTGDFNGDGKSDILWRNTDGTLIEWEMDGAALISGGVIGSDSNWSVVGAGDFNGDGKTDLLQRDARTGHVLQTLMDGRTAIGAQVIGGDQDWKVAGTGDFNGDGKSDILWRNTDGALVKWEMDGASLISGSVIGSDPNWSVVGTGDFNGDGKSDILQRHASNGYVLESLTNGQHGFDSQVIGGDLAWSVVSGQSTHA